MRARLTLPKLVHRFGQRPLETVAILATLAFGVGLLSAILSILDALVEQPMTSFVDAERVGAIVHQRRPGAPSNGPEVQPLALVDFRQLAEVSGTLSEVAAGQAIRVLLRDGSVTQRLDGEMVSANFFSVAKVEPEHGRFFHPEEAQGVGTGPVVVLADAFWRAHFGADRGVIGRTITLNGAGFEIVGVAPAGFLGSNRLNPADFWVPLSMYRDVFVAPQLVEQRDGRFLRVWGRVADDATFEQAESELDVIAARWSADWPDSHGTFGLALRPLAGGAPTGLQKALGRGAELSIGVATSLLGLGCLNVANLMLVRARSRRRGILLRLALGASRRRLVAAEVLDALTLCALGGLLGGLVATWARRILWSWRPPYLDERIVPLDADPKLFGLALGVALATGLVFAVAPVIAALGRIDLAQALKTAEEPSMARFRKTRKWPLDGQVVLQAALSTLVLGLAFLFLDGLRESQQTDLGFRSEGLVLVSYDLQLDGMTADRQVSVRDTLLDSMRNLPGVQSVGLAENFVLGGFRIWRHVAVEGGEPATVGSGRVGPTFFDSVGLRRLAGRGFSDVGTGGRTEVVINAVLAEQLFGGVEAAIDRRLVVEGDADYAITGVVENSAILKPGEDPVAFLYLPLDLEQPTPRFTLHLEPSLGSAGAAAVLRAVRTKIDSVAPEVPVERLTRVEALVAQALWLERLSAGLLGALALVGLLIASVGIYAVSAAEAQRRRQEMGVRLAIGAGREQIVLPMLSRGLGAVALGCTVGLLLVAWSASIVQGLLYDTGSLRVTTLATALGVLVSLGGVAQLLPAWRAATVDPVQVLYEP